MKTRTLKPAFVVTVSTLGAACGGPSHPGNPPRVDIVTDPSGGSTGTAAASSSAAPTSALTGAAPAYTRQLNARTAEGNEIYRAGAGCVIHVAGPPAGSWQPPTTKSVACPPAMQDEAWTACEGTLSGTEDLSECMCSVDGNPPPPDWKVPCPKVK